MAAGLLGAALAPAGPAAAQNACDPDTALAVAFARLGPLAVHAGPDLARPSPRDVAFGEAMAVVGRQGQAIALCLDGRRRWADRAHLMVRTTMALAWLKVEAS
ncbi:MAG: hypothetical protein AAF677_15575, partial [Pseudomonadota bacterium]